MSHFPKIQLQYDIFISYASVDNVTISEAQVGWIEEFKKSLELCLVKRVGKIGSVKIWCGLQVQGNQIFDDTIKRAIEEVMNLPKWD